MQITSISIGAECSSMLAFDAKRRFAIATPARFSNTRPVTPTAPARVRGSQCGRGICSITVGAPRCEDWAATKSWIGRVSRGSGMILQAPADCGMERVGGTRSSAAASAPIPTRAPARGLPARLQVNDLEMLHPLRQVQQRCAVLGVVLGLLRITASIALDRIHGVPERYEHEFHRVSQRTPKKHPAAIAAHLAVIRVGGLLQESHVFVGFGRAGAASPYSDDHRYCSVWRGCSLQERPAWGLPAKRE